MSVGAEGSDISGCLSDCHESLAGLVRGAVGLLGRDSSAVGRAMLLAALLVVTYITCALPMQMLIWTIRTVSQHSALPS